ncbi:KIN14B-interacting protein At4g14310-like [Musa acuminata AAA Group]|uniref:KIN14B-interacting protein At4g14310-like n=1 Tax=Musa acuminata AAA Group TaxID=214697 RepID=UPI0031D4138E
MSSRIKERCGGGGKIPASKPQKLPFHSTPKDKAAPAARRTPIAAGKENLRTLSGGKISSIRPTPVPRLVEKPAAAVGVRWSTSSLPRGKAVNPSDLSRLVSDFRGNRRLPRVSSSDRTAGDLGRDLEAEAGRSGGVRDSDGCHQGKGVLGSNLKKNNERQATRIAVSQQQNPKPNGFIGLPAAKKDAKATVATSEKLSGRTAAGVASEKHSRKEVAAIKLLVADGGDDCAKEKGTTAEQKKETNLLAQKSGVVCSDRSKHKVWLVSCSTSTDGKTAENVSDRNGLKGRSCTASNSKALNDINKDTAPVLSNDKKKDCIVVQSQTSQEAGGDVDIKNDPSEKRCIDSVPTVKIPEKSSADVTVFEKVKDYMKGAPVANKQPSKLHEKLALLEGKVQKIASEIKRTKEMLDSNNPDESKLILSDIQSKISGIEKAVGCTIDGTICQFGPSKIMKGVDCHNNHNVVSRQCEEISVPGHLVNDSIDEGLQERLFPHHKLLTNRRSSGRLGTNHNSNPDVEDGPGSPIEANPIALEFLASLNSVQAEPSKSVSIGHVAVRELGVDKGSSDERYVSRKKVIEHCKAGIELNEKHEEFEDREKKTAMMLHVDNEEPCVKHLCEIGQKPSTGGWFVSEGEAILLAHDEGSCSYYDIANNEFKAVYNPPGVTHNIWGDCWLIRAPGTDGCFGKYVVAASAGNALESGFCSWDFYTGDVKAFSLGDVTTNSFSPSSSRIVLGSLSNRGFSRSASCSMQTVGQPQWWYRPCGPLLICTGSGQKVVSAYDIRDGDLIMKWEVKSPVTGMEYSSPLQWRSRGKVVVAGSEAISLWDVNSLTPQPLLSVTCAGKKVHSLHVNNTDAESGCGVRQRASSSEMEGNDGVFCMQESINVLDFRVPAGVGLKISRHGGIGHSIFSRGDSILVGSTEARLAKGSPRSRVQHFSLRKGKLVTTYELPEFNAHSHYSSLTQVWGNTNVVMGVCGMGLFVFDAFQDERSQAFCFDRGNTVCVKESIGPDDLYCPTFDYCGSRVLVISRDRPALWRYL